MSIYDSINDEFYTFNIICPLLHKKDVKDYIVCQVGSRLLEVVE